MMGENEAGKNDEIKDKIGARLREAGVRSILKNEAWRHIRP